MRKYVQAVLGVIVGIALSPTASWAQDDTTINRSRSFLETTSRAKVILFCAHPEADYQSLRLVGQSKVVDDKQEVVPGHYALTYRYAWKSGLSGDDNTTDLVFFFNQGGRLYALNAGPTSSFFRPFGVADIVVKEFGDQIIKKVDEKGSEADKRLIRVLIQNRDARGLLTMMLRLDQP